MYRSDRVYTALLSSIPYFSSIKAYFQMEVALIINVYSNWHTPYTDLRIICTQYQYGYNCLKGVKVVGMPFPYLKNLSPNLLLKDMLLNIVTIQS